MHRWKMGIAAGGLAGMLVTCILFFLFLPESQEYRLIYLAFLLTAEGVAAGTPFISDRLVERGKHVFIVTGWSVTLGIEASLMFVITLLFLLWFPQAVPLFLGIQLILIGVSAVILGAVYAFGTRISGVSEEEYHAYAVVSEWEQRLQRLRIRTDQKETSEKLKFAAENLRFTDKSIRAAEDQQIEACIAQLEKCTVENGADLCESKEVPALLTQLEQLIAARKYKAPRI